VTLFEDGGELRLKEDFIGMAYEHIFGIPEEVALA